MGVTIQFESHRVELPVIYELEHDRDVLEYYDQPPSIKLDYESASGKRVGVLHTADYFIVRNGGGGWVECKTEEELKRLSERNPNRYRSEDRWRCPPGEAYASNLGLTYLVRSSAEVDWTFQANIQFLEDYFRDDSGVPVVTAGQVIARATCEPGISLDQLLTESGGNWTRDAVYTLIARDQIYVDLKGARLSQPDKVKVFPTAGAAALHQAARLSRSVTCEPPRPPLDVGCVVNWDSKTWKIANLGAESVSLLDDHGDLSEVPTAAFEDLLKRGRLIPSEATPRANSTVLERLSRASERELKEANHRCDCVFRFLAGEKPNDIGMPDRTLRRWAVAYRDAERRLTAGFLGLLPRIGQRGNRLSKLPDATRTLMTEFIERDYETLKQKTKRASWLALCLACENNGIVAPSYKTFNLAIRERPEYPQVLKRQGHRAAYGLEPFHWELELQTPRHGERPFEIGHIDHTELDLELVSSNTGRPLGRPWFTLLVDSFSRRALAFYLTFDPPSYRSCMMVLRECVRRHSRLPQIIVVDGGPEFKSTYFETLLARYQCTKKTRPPAKARFGSVCERLFGTTNTQFIHNLQGNTQITRNVRQVTKGVDPKSQAVWTLDDLQQILATYLYEVYDCTEHPALGRAPREAFETRLGQTGHRASRIIPYDREFIIYTLPTTRTGTAKVDSTRGIKLNYLYYWCQGFDNSNAQTQRVNVRYDPFDASRAYAFVNGQWLECWSEYRHAFQGRSEREIILATQELRKQSRNQRQCSPITAKRLAELLAAAEGKEAFLAQRLKDQEVRKDCVAASVVTIAIAGQSGRTPHLHNVEDEPPEGRGSAIPAPQRIYQEF
jgi:transposase InsO family protein